MMKRAIAILVLMVLLVMGAHSRQTSIVGDRKSNLAVKELLKELRDYAQANIVPKMTRFKNQLDNAMTPYDLQALNELRARASRLKNAALKDVVALKGAWQSGNLVAMQRLAAQLKSMAPARDGLLKELKPLGEKYKTTLVQIGTEAKPFAQEWKDGLKKVGATWYEANKNDLAPAYKQALAKGIAKLKALAGIDGDLKSKLAAAKFMLWDGSDLPDVSQMMADENLASESSTNAEGYALDSNYPNPFNPSTTISFTIPQAQHVSLVVYDALGREVATLVDSELGAGSHTVTFEGQNLSSGVYIYRIRSGDFVQEKKMQLLK
jgi:hypothetical protein